MQHWLDQTPIEYIAGIGTLLFTTLLVFDNIGFRFIGSVLVRWFSCGL